MMAIFFSPRFSSYIFFCLLDKLNFCDSVVTLESLSAHAVDAGAAPVVLRAERDNIVVAGARGGPGPCAAMMYLGWRAKVTKTATDSAPLFGYGIQVSLFSDLHVRTTPPAADPPCRCD
jgi:hypothetical protein